MDIYTWKALQCSMPKLNGRVVICIGDSLMAENAWDGGFANIIKEKHPTAKVTNIAVSGSKVTGGSVFQQIADYYVAHGIEEDYYPDLIVICAGGNDFINRETIGTLNMASSYPPGDSSTFANALETMYHSVKTVYPKSKIIHLTLPFMQQWDDGNVVPGVPVPSVQKQYWDVLRQACEKWSIPIADLNKDANITSANTSQLGTFYLENDTIHFNELGYRAVYPVLESVINKIF